MSTFSRGEHRRSKTRDRTVAPMPPLPTMLNPIRYVGWGWEFTTRWLSTRPIKRNYLAALPFAIVCTALIAWRLAPVPSIRPAYESAVKYGVTTANGPLTRLSIQRLVSDYPNEMEYQRLLAEQMLRDGDLVVATRILHRLTAPDSSANGKQRALANLSLAKLSADTSNRFTLTPIDFQERLHQTIETLPEQTEAHQMLSMHYLRREQYAKAEPHVAHTAGNDPARLFGLSQIQVRIGKREQAQETATKADRAVSATIESGKATPEDYVLKASLLNSLGNPDAAEKILTEGLQREPEKFRAPLATHYTARARQKLRLSPFYRRQATVLLVKAFTVAPNSPIVAEVLTELANDEQGLSGALSDKLEDHWKSRTLQPDASARTLASAAKFRRLKGDMENAVQLLERAAAQEHGYRDLLVEAYYSSGSTDKAMELFDEISEQYRTQLADQPNDEAARIRLARILSGVDQLSEAETVLREAATETKKIALELVEVLQKQLSGSEEAGDSPDRNQLKDALKRAPFNGYLLSMMAKHAVDANREVAEDSRQFILQLVANGTMPSGLAYGALGTAELDAKRYQQAEADLIQSVRLQPQNPLALNNLAITLVRKDSPNPTHALQAVERALRLLPDHEVLLATKGEVLLMAERWAEATQALQRAVRLGKNTVEIHQQLAMGYRKLGNEELAAQHDRLAEAAAE